MQICIICYGLIHQAYNFKTQCKKSDSILRTYLKDNSIEVVKIEETVKDEFEQDDTTEELTEDDDDVMLTAAGSEDMDDENMSLELEMSYSCKNCNGYFLLDEELKKHEKNCFKMSKTRHCPRCLKEFKHGESLQMHYAHCKSHECTVCKKKFRTSGFLQVSILEIT